MDRGAVSSDVSRETFEKIVKTEAEKLGLKLSEFFYEKGYEYLKEMLFWNKTHNLTTITDFCEAALLHFADSLVPATVEGLVFDGASVLDVGTGGGFPGVPLALIFPKAKFTLLDKARKKISFINLTSASLGIDNVTGICENLFAHQQHYDLIISRAVRIDAELFDCCRKMLNKNGRLCFWFSSNQDVFQDGSLKEIKSYKSGEIERKIAVYQF